MNPDKPVNFHSPQTLPEPMGYSHVVDIRRGRMIYISGQVARDASGALVGNDFRTQLTQVFANLRHAVQAAGGTFDDVIKLNYFCCDSVPPADQVAVREVRDQFVNTKTPPASTFVVVRRLARPEWLIEIEAIAVIAE